MDEIADKSATSKIAETFDTASPKDPLLGKTVGDRYAVEELIGMGGWGRVYRVLHSGLNKHLALKLLHSSHVFDREKLARFKQEAEAVSSLDHPNICRVVDFAEGPEGQPCMVMELLVGQRLDEVIKDKPLPVSEVVNVGVQLCSALSAAHTKGVIHRDLKPSNVMICDNQVKVLDFGLAKIVDEEAQGGRSLTETGLVLGTPAYMSPEQCLGQRVDARTDVYAIGCILYEAATGKKAFDGASFLEIMNAHLQKTPKEFAAANASDAEKSLQAVLLKAMEQERDARYQTVGDLLADLTKLQSQQKVVVAKTKKRKSGFSIPKAVTVTVCAGAMLGLLGLAIILWTKPPAPQPENAGGLTLHRIEKYKDKTLAEWTKEIENDPNNAEWYVNRGMLHYERDERDSAIEDFGKALELDPKNLVAYDRRAEMFVMVHQFDKALAEINTAIKLSPRWYEGYAERARINYLMERYADAIKDSKRALQLNSMCNNALSTLAATYEALGDFDHAQDCIQRMFALGNANADEIYWNNYDSGMLYLRARDYERAIEHFRTALHAHSLMSQSWGDMASAYAGKGDMENAEHSIKNAMSLDSFPARAYRLKGEMYRAAGMWAQAAQEYSTSTSLEPWFGPGFEQRAYAELGMGQDKSALTDLERATKSMPDSARIWSALAMVEDQLGKSAESQAHLKKAFDLQPNLADVFLNRAHIEMNHGDYEPAIKDLNKAIDLNHRLADAYATRAIALTNLGQASLSEADANVARGLFYHAPDVPLKIEQPRDKNFVRVLPRPPIEIGRASVDIAQEVLPADKQFALGCSAIWTNTLASNSGNSENVIELWTISPQYEKELNRLLRSWDAHDKASLMKALDSLSAPSADKAQAAMDHVRYIALCRMGFMAGYLTEDEAWKLILPMAHTIRQQFSSWDELATNYARQRREMFGDSGDPVGFEKLLGEYLTDPKRPPKTIPFKG